MIKVYSIVQWNPIISGNTTPKPTIYIPSDSTLQHLYHNSSGIVTLQITDTDSSYDNVILNGTIEPSSVIGGYRPNFQEQTNLWAVKLNTMWNGYPPKNGKLSVLYGTETASNTKKNNKKSNKLKIIKKEYTQSKDNKIGLVISVLLMVLILYIILRVIIMGNK